MRHRRWLLALLVSLASVSLSASTTGHPVSPVTYGPYAAGSGGALIASNGSSFVSVWNSFPSTIFASHLDANGQVDTAHAVKLPLLPQAYAETLMRSGENFLLVWNASSTRYATLLRPDLEVVRTFELRAGYGRIAANANRILYLSYDYAPGRPAAVLLDLNGDVLTNTVVMRDQVQDSITDVIADDSGFTVIMGGLYGIYVQNVSNDGVAGEPLQLLAQVRTTWWPSSIAAARRNGSIFVAWTVSSIVSAPDSLHGLLVDREGHLTAEHQIAIPGTAVQLLAAEPTADGLTLFAHTGTWQTAKIKQLTMWSIALSDRDFTATALTDVPENPDQPIQDVAIAGAAIVGVRTAVETTPLYEQTSRILATRLDQTAAEPELLSILPAVQTGPAIASDGLDFMVTWSERTLDRHELAGLSVTAAGAPRNAAFAIPARAADSAMAFGSSTFLVIWTADTDIHGAFVLPSGVVVSAFEIPGQAPRQPSVVWDGSRFALVWTDVGEIFGTFVTPSGNVAEPRQLSSRKPTDIWAAAQPDIAWNGRVFLVGWTTDTSGAIICTCLPPPKPAYVRVVSTDGMAIGDAVTVDPDTDGIQLASDGNAFAVIAKHAMDVTFTNVEVFGDVPIVRDTIPVFRWIGTVDADIDFDGRDYAIALRYFAPGGAAHAWLATAHIADGEILQRRFTPIDGTIASGAPAIASNSAGENVIAISQVPADIGTARVYTFPENEFDPLPPPPPPPMNVRAAVVSCSPPLPSPCTLVTWSGSDRDAGYVVERQVSDGRYVFLTETPAGTHRVLLSYIAEVASIRVRAAGPGGLSEPSEFATAGAQGRRRGARP